MACNDIPRLLVERDAAAPAETRYGLFAAATIVEDMDPKAGNGITYTTTCTPGVYPYPVGDCDDDEVPAKHAERSMAITSADPFAVYAAEACPPAGRGTVNRQVEALRRRLVKGERHVVEAAVYNGHAGASPYLRHADTVQIDTGEDLPIAQAVGVLEHWLAARGRTGTIHAPRWMAPVMRGLVSRDGPRMRTLLGNTVAFGSGYSGQGPEGVDDDQVWLYATPQVTIHRSNIVEQRTFNTATNQPFDLAERVYVVDWPCAAAAVVTDLARIDGLVPDPDPTELALVITPDSGPAPLTTTMTPTGFGGGQVTLSWVDGTPVNAITEDGVGHAHTFSTPGVYTVTAFSTEDTSLLVTSTVTVTEPDG